ncbi:hypothetical protein C7N43_21160 [Sphingobacteriales bacterium UPWRP_1]|nr:hypothetical protein BVG80_16035 [Sphingobacteriales bacterium TSM_CSM]PSJ74983.1 hypothetical protein C7N43_21160 [Sphingobacteriales bacterium UPWRP_1]
MYKSLIHLGYGKAGTTFLHKWFQEHPQLVYRQFGIGGFTDIKEIYQYLYELPDGHKPVYFVTSHEDLSFWKGPIGSIGAELIAYSIKEHQQRVCNWLYALMPNSVILIITRGFETIIKSGYSQYVRIGGNLHFDVFIQGVKSLILDFWDYDYLIGLYQDKFGKENVIVLPYELLEENSIAFIREIEERLQIEHFEFKPQKVHPSYNSEHIYWRVKIANYCVTLAKWLPPAVAQRLYQLYIAEIANNSNSSLINLLIRCYPNRKEQIALPDSYIAEFKYKAKLLKAMPVYKHYLRYYLQCE